MANGAGSVLARIGQGALSFASGKSQSEIGTIRSNRDIAAQGVELQQQDLEANQRALDKDQRREILVNEAFGGGPESDRAKAQFAVEFPEEFEQIAKSAGLNTQGKKTEAADFATRLKSVPFDQRQTMIDQRVTELSAVGRDPQHTASLTGLSEEDQNDALTTTELLALTPAQRFDLATATTRASGSGAGFEEQFFRRNVDEVNRIESIPEDERSQADKSALQALKIELRTAPGAVGSGAITAATQAGLTEKLAESGAIIKERTKFAELTASSRGKAIDKGFELIKGIDKNVRNMDRAILALEQGADTGAIERFFPSIKEASVKLENIQSELALDVVGSVTFGALSQGELDLARSVALPTGLNAPALLEHLQDRKVAQAKLRSYYVEQIDFLDQGGSIAGFIRSKERELDTGGGGDTGGVQEGQTATGPNGEKVVFSGGQWVPA